MYVNLEPNYLDTNRVQTVKRHISQSALLGENFLTIRRPMIGKEILNEARIKLSEMQPGNALRWRLSYRTALGLTVLSEADTNKEPLQNAILFDAWNDIVTNVPELGKNVRIPNYDIKLENYTDGRRAVNIVFGKDTAKRLRDQRLAVGATLRNLADDHLPFHPKHPHITLAYLDEGVKSYKARKYVKKIDEVLHETTDANPNAIKLSRAAFRAGIRLDALPTISTIDSGSELL